MPHYMDRKIIENKRGKVDTICDTVPWGDLYQKEIMINGIIV